MAPLQLPVISPESDNNCARELHLEDDECRVMARVKSRLISNSPRMFSLANRCSIKESKLYSKEIDGILSQAVEAIERIPIDR